MYVVPIGPAAALAILLKQLLKAVKQIGLDSEVRKLMFALRLLASQTGQLLARIAMEGVTINKRGMHILAHEHALESTPDRGSAGTGRAGNGNDWILPRHQRLSVPLAICRSRAMARWAISCRHCTPRHAIASTPR